MTIGDASHRKRLSLAFVAAVMAGAMVSSVPGAAHVAQASGVTYAVENMLFPGNQSVFSGCEPGATTTCVESVALDGIQLTRIASAKDADVLIRGAVFGFPCRFVETTAGACEFPYFSVVRQNALAGQQLGTMTLSMRRRSGSSVTDRIGSVVANGEIVSFLPSAAGIRDVATLVIKPVTLQIGSTCVGFSDVIEQCVMSESATRVADNQIIAMMLPGLRSSVTPPDVTAPGCALSSYRCVVTVLEKSTFGSWIETTASTFGEMTSERVTGASQLKVAGPHFKFSLGAAGTKELNLAHVKMFMTAEHLWTRFGLRPTEANAKTLPVTKTLGSAGAALVTSYQPTQDGLLIDTRNISFSQPTVSVSRILVVKRGKRVTLQQIAGAAGISTARRFGEISVQSGRSKKYVKAGKAVVFTKTGTVVLSVKYKSTARDTSTRRLTVQVE